MLNFIKNISVYALLLTLISVTINGIEINTLEYQIPIDEKAGNVIGRGFIALIGLPIFFTFIAFLINFVGSKFFNKSYTLLGTTKNTFKLFIIFGTITIVVRLINII